MGLLVAHILCSPQVRFSQHWSMPEDGAVTAGTFGKFMPRNRYQDILRDLHFVDNESQLVTSWESSDQWLIGYKTLPCRLDPTLWVLPATSKRNNTRMFMPDKPHRYGSKMFMTCDARAAYCHR
ncbi:hypothetical protein PHMEG_00021137 [Phytophthora megakarya]|uniref:PiggyBac transposable element-derived protein domain-containing protein n=1 Tax=Phytophthora megakarya TaxID=4795 RepID=A0A225VM40_9STRA|nr:hypothetical protein PHMEG_00021137 [Phytophthora megakarya]